MSRLEHLRPVRPLVAVDTETTGVDPQSCRVVEVAAVRLAPGVAPTWFHARVDPGVPIPPAATAVHGIADADIRGKPPFAALARRLAGFLAGADLVAYSAPYDLAVLAAEFARAGVPFAVTGRAVLDPLAVFRRHEPHTLSNAVRVYLGRDHAAAHSAQADTTAALAVIDAQVGRYALPADPADLHRALWPVDVGGRFALDPGGEPVFGFGKHRGLPLATVAAADPGYLRWVLDALPLLDDARDLVARTLAVVGSR